MKTTMRWLIFALVIGFVWEHGIAGTILGTEGRKSYPTTFTTQSSVASMSVYGDWIENIDRATTTAPGVTVNIISKQNGAQNNSGPFSGKGKVSLRINTSNATPGNKTISLINDPDLGVGGETFTLTITVVASTTVASVDVPTPAVPFQEITITLNGTGLQEAKDPASGVIVIDNLIPFITVGGNANVSSVRVLSSSATSLQAKIFFSALIQDATLDLSFRSDNAGVPLGVSTTFKKRVRVKSSNIQNYVKSFSFPQGSTFDKNSIGTINLHLLFPAPSSGRATPILSITGGGGTENATVFFKFAPPNAFARPDGTPFPTITGGFIQVRANAGEDIIPITFKVIDCLGGQTGQTNVVKIQTWMHSTNTNLPPNFVEKTFNVRCIQ